MKRLKQDVDLIAFLDAVSLCSADVMFQTEDGDSLNLKSTLSKYLFSMVATNQRYILTGEVICRLDEDYHYLKEYVYEG